MERTEERCRNRKIAGSTEGCKRREERKEVGLTTAEKVSKYSLSPFICRLKGLISRL